VKIYAINREWAYVTFTLKTGTRVRAIYCENKPKYNVHIAPGTIDEIFSENRGRLK
jgi:hypothetical protein